MLLQAGIDLFVRSPFLSGCLEEVFLNICWEKVYFLCVCLCLQEMIYTIGCENAQEGEKREADLLQSKLRAVLSCLMWVGARN